MVNFQPHTVGDGYCTEVDASWSTARDDTTADSRDNTAETYTLINHKVFGSFAITRIYIPFDTSAIPNNANITAATLAIVLSTKNGFHNITKEAVLTGNTQNNPLALMVADYDEIVVDSPVEASNRITLDVFPSVKTFTFSAAGLELIRRKTQSSTNGLTTVGWSNFTMRGSNDVDDSEPVFIDINCTILSGDTPVFKPTLAVTYNEATIHQGTIQEGTIEA